jgi:hypothetical protein
MIYDSIVINIESILVSFTTVLFAASLMLINEEEQLSRETKSIASFTTLHSQDLPGPKIVASCRKICQYLFANCQ